MRKYGIYIIAKFDFSERKYLWDTLKYLNPVFHLINDYKKNQQI